MDFRTKYAGPMRTLTGGILTDHGQCRSTTDAATECAQKGEN